LAVAVYFAGLGFQATALWAGDDLGDNFRSSVAGPIRGLGARLLITRGRDKDEGTLLLLWTVI
jgi:hypothetical protein